LTYRRYQVTPSRSVLLAAAVAQPRDHATALGQ
jgi:hypothetical protein